MTATRQGRRGATLAVLLVVVLASFSCHPEAASTNERNSHVTSSTSTSTSTSTSFAQQAQRAAATTNVPSTVPKRPTSPASSISSSSTYNDTLTPPIQNENGTQSYYMTAQEDDGGATKQTQTTTVARRNSLYRIDEYIQNKISTNQDVDNTLPVASMAVGVLTAAVGVTYVSILSNSRRVIWDVLPQKLLLANNSMNNPTSKITAAAFIVSITTLGGLLLGYFSTTPMAQPSDGTAAIYTASDFVSIVSENENNNNNNSQEVGVSPSSSIIPAASKHLLPLLTMSLLTSIAGIPIGPEAPMVGAGTLIGAAIAKYLYKGENFSTEKEQTLAFCGVAGALTGSMGIPIVGGIFALEMVRSDTSLFGSGASSSKITNNATTMSMLSSLAAIVALKFFMQPSSTVGGHFDFFSFDQGGSRRLLDRAVTGRAMIVTTVASGVGGSILGTTFHKLYKTIKLELWKEPSSSTSTISEADKKALANRRKVLVRTCIGMTIGLIAALYPQALFWGEGGLQAYIDGQQTSFGSTKHGLPNFLYAAARVDPTVPYANSWAALQVGVAKFLAIVLASAGKFSGGIVFPLFATAPAFVHAIAPTLSKWHLGHLIPMAVMCTMAATQSSATRTPLASALILALFASTSTEISVILPACLISSYQVSTFPKCFQRNHTFIIMINKDEIMRIMAFEEKTIS
eukprot:CAMPEP_0113490504 /NCGR_PEP_ID=MMETSP0014_2-20120614/27081_1 /TAXON_ID=2857 /ORGANISM="Nitzschia sp." /LENGTH=686 /DNA_ID=CAMNT_0000384279 /DNA_START=83 /DNA_END=2141 /DNA_ORIENTATION=- /assembly_acc=CAM_ASM_000159